MSNAKFPDSPSGPGYQGFAAQGLAAYQQTLGPKKPSPDTSPLKTFNRKGIPPGKEGPQFIKTNNPAKNGAIPLQKTWEKVSRPESPAGEGESKHRRVAKLLILIGAEEAAKILSHLDSEQVEIISKEIAAIRGITSEESASILAEFRSLLSASYRYGAGNAGGLETAREILHAAFGKEKGEALLRKTVPESVRNPLRFLEKIPSEQLVLLFKDESPAAEALVLSRLSPKLAAEVLVNTQPRRKIELIQRIAHLDKTSPEVIDRIAQTLKEKVQRLGESAVITQTTGIDGLNALTAILKSSDPSFGDRILAELGNDDPSLQADLKERLHTLDEVVKAEDRAIQDKLFTMADQELVLLLKNRSEAFTEKILSNISAERRDHLREEADILGPVRRRDADRAAKNFLDWFRENREAGHIILIDDEDIIV